MTEEKIKNIVKETVQGLKDSTFDIPSPGTPCKDHADELREIRKDIKDMLSENSKAYLMISEKLTDSIDSKNKEHREDINNVYRDYKDCDKVIIEAQRITNEKVDKKLSKKDLFSWLAIILVILGTTFTLFAKH